MRKGASEHVQENARSYLNNPLTGTSDEREAAVMAIGEVVTELEDVVQDYRCECNLHEIDKHFTD